MYFLGFFRTDIAGQKALFKGSYHRLKAAANSSLMMRRRTPAKVVFFASWVCLMTYSKSFTLGNRK